MRSNVQMNVVCQFSKAIYPEIRKLCDMSRYLVSFPLIVFSILSIGSTAYGTGYVQAWGYDYEDECDVPAETQSGVTQIVAGMYHSLALKNGEVIAWGKNTSVPGPCDVPTEAQSGVTQIAAGYVHSLALKDGKVIAWGYNDSGQTNVPTEAQNGVTQIAAGIYHSLALKDGKVIAWGYSYSGYNLTNVPVEAQSGVTQVAAGCNYSLALKNGKVIAWSYDYYGNYTSLYVPVEAQSGVTQIVTGRGFSPHSLALKDGEVIAWGDNNSGQCDVPVNAQSGVTQVAAGNNHSLALKDGEVIAWGDNVFGECNVPEDARSGVTRIAAGYHSLSLKTGTANPMIQFSAISTSVNESVTSVTLSVLRFGGSYGAASVHYATANGTALASTNYATTSGDFTWASGNYDTKEFSVYIYANSVSNGDKSFTVQLSNVSGASLGSLSTETITIEDNETPRPPIPVIMANGLSDNITINSTDNLSVTVQLNPKEYAGTCADWWVVALAGTSWYYLNNSMQWMEFDGYLSNCYPVYQGALFDLPAAEALNITGLATGLYTFWFAVDFPMDGLLDLDGLIWLDSVSVAVQ